MWRWFVLARVTSSTGTCRCTILRRTLPQRREPPRWMSSSGRSITSSRTRRGPSRRTSWPLRSAASTGKFTVRRIYYSVSGRVWPEAASLEWSSASAKPWWLVLRFLKQHHWYIETTHVRRSAVRIRYIFLEKLACHVTQDVRPWLHSQKNQKQGLEQV